MKGVVLPARNVVSYSIVEKHQVNMKKKYHGAKAVTVANAIKSCIFRQTFKRNFLPVHRESALRVSKHWRSILSRGQKA